MFLHSLVPLNWDLHAPPAIAKFKRFNPLTLNQISTNGQMNEKSESCGLDEPNETTRVSVKGSHYILRTVEAQEFR